MMLAVNYSNLRENLKEFCDKATDDCEEIIITRKDNKNVVLLSLDEYNNLKENLYIMSNRKNYERLLKAKEHLESGENLICKNMDELRALENE